MPVDIAVVGNAARGPKGGGGPKELVSFSVRKGDNGGVMISESYESKPPEGRRRGAAFPGGFDSKENAFGPSERAAALQHVQGLLVQMGGGEVEGPAEDQAEGGVEEPPAPPPTPPPGRGVPMRPAAPPFAE